MRPRGCVAGSPFEKERFVDFFDGFRVSAGGGSEGFTDRAAA